MSRIENEKKRDRSKDRSEIERKKTKEIVEDPLDNSELETEMDDYISRLIH